MSEKEREANEQESPAVNQATEETKPQESDSDRDIEREIRGKSRRSFIVGGVAAMAAIGGWEWLKTRPEDGGIPWPLRRGLEINEQFARDYFNRSREAQTFTRDAAKIPRPNGDLGLSDDFDPATWRLRVVGLNNPESVDPGNSQKGGRNDSEETFRDEKSEAAVVHLTLDDIKQLPRVELMTQLKCIEGWADMGFWAGARLSDFMEKYPPATRSGDPPDVRNRPDDLVRYVSLATPDGGYYVGFDMVSALHPQTLLVYEMGGNPLTPEHGAPLRLYIPVKYGIKSLKRIGTIRFMDSRPADYWAEQGYDWYAGH